MSGSWPVGRRVHRLRTVRARELELNGGATLGEGTLGKLQLGVWNDNDVAVKATGTQLEAGCTGPEPWDAATIMNRARGMWVPRGPLAA